MGFPLTITELLGHALLFLLVFGMSATVDLTAVQKQLRNCRALSMGVFLQFVILPFLGFITVKMLKLDKVMGLTLLVVTSSPGGSYSNWWCSIFNADLALSVTMTAISTLLAIIMLPLNLAIYTPMIFNGDDDAQLNVYETIDFGSLMTSIFVVFGAIGSGVLASIKVDNHNFHIWANRLGSFAGISLVILSGIASSTIDGAEIWTRDAKFFFGVAMPCLIALLISNLLTTYFNLKKPERVTCSIECCYQNCGIATSVALSMFQGDNLAEAMGVPFVYGIVELVIISMYCVGAWKAGWTKAPPTDPLWKVVTENYEVLLAENMASSPDSDDGSWENVDSPETKGDYLRHAEDDIEIVEAPTESKKDEKAEKLVDNEEGIPATSLVSSVGEMSGKMYITFWKGLGYKV